MLRAEKGAIGVPIVAPYGICAVIETLIRVAWIREMIRAEEAAFKAFPDYPSMDGGYITQRKQRAYYIKGYEQAERDLIERAEKWLEQNVEYWMIATLDGKVKMSNLFLERFKQAMK